MNIKVLDIEGIKKETLKVSDNLMALKPNNRLLKYVVDWQINHAKKRLAKTGPSPCYEGICFYNQVWFQISFLIQCIQYLYAPYMIIYGP